MNIFLTSDLHFSHANIIRYCDRPFKDTDEMDETLIENWNAIVNDGDMVYNLGDLSMQRGKGEKVISYYSKILSRLNGRHVLIMGNHDHMKPFQYVEAGIESVHTSLIVTSVKGNVSQEVLMAHDPAIATAMPEDMIMFCGHVHDTFRKLNTPKRILNVGVDIWGYKPVEWNVAIKALREDPQDTDIRIEDLNNFDRHPGDPK